LKGFGGPTFCPLEHGTFSLFVSDPVFLTLSVCRLLLLWGAVLKGFGGPTFGPLEHGTFSLFVADPVFLILSVCRLLLSWGAVLKGFGGPTFRAAPPSRFASLIAAAGRCMGALACGYDRVCIGVCSVLCCPWCACVVMWSAPRALCVLCACMPCAMCGACALCCALLRVLCSLCCVVCALCCMCACSNRVHACFFSVLQAGLFCACYRMAFTRRSGAC